LVGLAESSTDKANLIAQACFGIFAVLNAVLDQNRMEERHKRGLDRSRGFRSIFDVELSGFDPLAYDRLEDRHHPFGVRLDDRPVLLHGSDNQVVHVPLLDQRHLVVAVNGGHELIEFFHGRRVRACDRKGDVSNLVQNTPADRLVDRIPGGKETVDIRWAHAEFGCDVGHRRLMITDAAKVLLRHLQDARAPHLDQLPFGLDGSWIQQSPTRQPLLFAIPVPPSNPHGSHLQSA
jgi:hypothetical protein